MSHRTITRSRRTMTWSHPAMLALLLTMGAPMAARAQEHDAGLRSEVVRFRAPDGVELVGDLYLPDGAGPHGAVVLLHGSGPETRGNMIFGGLAHFFTAQGIAVLAFDKRGIGESGGEYVESPLLENSAGDGLAAVRALADRADIDRSNIGVWGISQGGWVGPLMATMSDDVAWVIAVSGPGVSPMVQTLYQREMEMVEEGWTAADASEAAAMRLALWHYAATGDGRDAAVSALAYARTRPWFARLDETPQVGGPEHVPAGAAAWLRHAQYEPAPVLERIRVPVLALFGRKDRHIPVEASVVAMRAAFARGDVDATIVELDDAGHGMQRVDGPAESLLAMRARHAAPGGARHDFQLVDGYPQAMMRWLVEHDIVAAGG